MSALSLHYAAMAAALKTARSRQLWGIVRDVVTLGIEMRRLSTSAAPATPPPLTRQLAFHIPLAQRQLLATKQLRAAMAVPQPNGWKIVYPLPLPSRAGPKAPIAKCVRRRGPFAMRKIHYSVGGGPRAPVSVRSVVVQGA